MKLIFLLPFLIISCGNPHISSKEPPQLMVSPIQPEDETGSCAEDQQQQQQQQEDYVLLEDAQMEMLKKCKDNEVTLEKDMNKLTWSFDRPKLIWATKVPVKSGAVVQLQNCREETLKEFNLKGHHNRFGFSTTVDDVCRVTMTVK